MAAAVVHIIDDDESSRKATARLLAAEGYEAHAYESIAELPAARSDAAACVILDMQLPDTNGLDVQEEIAARPDPIPVIFLTGFGEVPDSVRAIQKGAVDFLTKPVKPETLLGAVRRAIDLDTAARSARRHRLALEARYARLTPRERQVLEHLIAGQLNKQVAADLDIAERTVKLHRANILQKLEADSMASLARLAVELGVSPRQTTRPVGARPGGTSTKDR